MVIQWSYNVFNVQLNFKYLSILYTYIQVLRLVHYLVSFGFYYKTEDIAALLEPLMGLLDGRNDKPYPDISGILTYSLSINTFVYA